MKRTDTYLYYLKRTWLIFHRDAWSQKFYSDLFLDDLKEFICSGFRILRKLIFILIFFGFLIISPVTVPVVSLLAYLENKE